MNNIVYDEVDSTVLPQSEDKIREQELKNYEDKYGKDATPEDEQKAILEDLMGESRDVMEMLGTVEAIYQHMPAIEAMDDEDRTPAINMLVERASKFQMADTSMEASDYFGSAGDHLNDRSDRNEGKIRSLMKWAGQAVVASYQIISYGLKRTSVYISRYKKSADGIEQRLVKLEGLMKNRKSEKNRIYFSKSKMLLLVEEYELNTSPASSVSSFAGTIYGIIDDYVGALRTISTKADADLSKGENAKIDMDSYNKIVSDLLEDLEEKFKDKELLIGNRYVKVNKSASPSKAISLAIGRPDPKSIVSKFSPMAALSNSAVESQRDGLRSGVLKKMYKMLDDTVSDMEAVTKLQGLSSKKDKKEKEESPDKKEVATLTKFLTDLTKELTAGIFVLADMVYDTVDAAVSLLEDSVTVTQIHGETEED